MIQNAKHLTNLPIYSQVLCCIVWRNMCYMVSSTSWIQCRSDNSENDDATTTMDKERCHTIFLINILNDEKLCTQLPWVFYRGADHIINAYTFVSILAKRITAVRIRREHMKMGKIFVVQMKKFPSIFADGF